MDADPATAIPQLQARIAELRAQVAGARERNHELRTARDYTDSLAAGYVDLNFLEEQ
ncbi:hypothetical protein [Streptomyces sp. NPDC101249]|uniref:hypothetical protein n=1 Tax=Streptomyces sp. NPDC101249 TaxID=3366140 RepID=UPI003817333B